jgi:hypothetical protein
MMEVFKERSISISGDRNGKSLRSAALRTQSQPECPDGLHFVGH